MKARAEMTPAEEAVHHLVLQLVERDDVYNVIGGPTTSFNLLMRAFACMHDVSIDEAERQFKEAVFARKSK